MIAVYLFLGANCIEKYKEDFYPKHGWVKIYPLIQEGPDIDIEQELPAAEFWLRKNGLLKNLCRIS